MFRAATFTMAKRWNGVEYYSALKRKEILSHITTQMNLKDTRLSEGSQIQKEKYYIIPFIGGSQTHRDRKENGDCQELGVGGNGELSLSGYRVST